MVVFQVTLKGVRNTTYNLNLDLLIGLVDITFKVAEYFMYIQNETEKWFIFSKLCSKWRFTWQTTYFLYPPLTCRGYKVMDSYLWGWRSCISRFVLNDEKLTFKAREYFSFKILKRTLDILYLKTCKMCWHYSETP